MNYKCPCCGYYTFGEKPNSTYDICEICFWEDESTQIDDPHSWGGANKVSLVEGRENFRLFGAMEERFVKDVRPPQPDELTGIDWEGYPQIKVALLIVDMQQAMITGEMYREEETLANIEQLLHAARDSGKPVIHVRHEYSNGKWYRGTPGWQIYAPLTPLPEEPIVDKFRNSAFYRTQLDALLKDLEIDTLVICGVHTEYCIDATIRSAFDREYAVIVPKEANSTIGNEYMTAERLHSYYNDFIWQGRYAQVRPLDSALRKIEWT